jgi:hypothetical protein
VLVFQREAGDWFSRIGNWGSTMNVWISMSAQSRPVSLAATHDVTSTGGAGEAPQAGFGGILQAGLVVCDGRRQAGGECGMDVSVLELGQGVRPSSYRTRVTSAQSTDSVLNHGESLIKHLRSKKHLR